MRNGHTPKIKDKVKHFFTIIKVHIYQILYVLLLIGLWVYIIVNWNKCISMKFFDQFDGNNILFFLGIILVIMFFYDVEAKDFKFRRRKNENMSRQIQNLDVNYQRNLRNVVSEQLSTNEHEEGGVNNERTNQTNCN